MGKNCYGVERGGAFETVRFLAMSVVVLTVSVAAASYARAAEPSTFTVETFENWLKQYADAKPSFKTGDVLTSKDLERMRPFMLASPLKHGGAARVRLRPSPARFQRLPQLELAHLAVGRHG